jgi:hypothetical protein
MSAALNKLRSAKNTKLSSSRFKTESSGFMKMILDIFNKDMMKRMQELSKRLGC